MALGLENFLLMFLLQYFILLPWHNNQRLIEGGERMALGLENFLLMFLLQSFTLLPWHNNQRSSEGGE